MDAITQGYSSDSESDSESKANKTSLGALTAYADDSDNDSNENEDTKASNISKEKSPPITSTSASPLHKKQRISQDNVINSLPSPTLLQANSNQNDQQRSMILFSKNYLESKTKYKQVNEDPSLIEKLHGLYSNDNSFAQQLKSQKEFGNPYLFPSAISHFGIEPIRSHASNLESSFQAFEYIERLLQKEEENRIRAFNNT